MNNEITVIKYLMLIYAFVKSRKIESPLDIQLTSSKSLFSDFKITKNNSTRVIETLEGLGVLKCSDASYTVGEQCKKYNISLSEYRDCLSVFLYYYWLIDEDIRTLPCLNAINDYMLALSTTSSLFSDKSAFTGNICVRTFKSRIQSELCQSDIDKIADFIISDMFGKNTRPKDLSVIIDKSKSENNFYPTVYAMPTERVWKVIKLINQRELSSLLRETTVTCPNSTEFTDEELEAVKSAYTERIAYIGVINDMADRLKKLQSMNYPIHASLNIQVRPIKGRLRLSFSSRQTNLWCQIESAKRKVYLDSEGYDGEYDIHSTIFAVARLLEKGLWDCDWDIKTELLKGNNIYKVDGTPLTRTELKGFMFRLFFAKSLSDAYNKYKRQCEYEQHLSANLNNGKIWDRKKEKYVDSLPIINRATFEKLFYDTYSLCGNIKKYSNTIFFYESILELDVIDELLERHCDVVNVYDCFYFKTNQISCAEVRNIITEKAMDMYREYNPEFEEIELWGEA